MKSSLRSFVLPVSTLFLLLVVAPRALASVDSADKTLAPYFRVEHADPNVDQLPLASTKVDIAVTDVIAAVTVTQRYENRGSRPINATYVFPASTRAAVDGLTMRIGSQLILAKIKERDQAKRTFEAAKRDGKSATLLEQERPNVFTMSVANVMPGDHIDVTLRYTELIVPTDGRYELVFPTVVGPRYSNQPEKTAAPSDQFVATPYLRAGVPPTSTLQITGTLASGIPLADVTSPSHRLEQSFDNPGLLRFSLDASEVHGGDRDFVLDYRLAGDAIQSGLTLFDAGSEKFFLLEVEPPARVTDADLPPREYVFIVDVSGSMAGFPLETAKSLLRDLVGGLRPSDRFDVLLFAGASELLSPRSLPATPENVARAVRAIDEQHGGGGTELLPALEQALSLSPEVGVSRSFIVVTDGFVDADRQAMDFVRQHLGEANAFAFGIGDSVNRYLIEGVARAGFGEPFVVTNEADAAQAAHRFRDYVRAPVLTNVRIDYGDFDVYDVMPRAVPDVLAARPVIAFGKYRGTPRGTIEVSGVGGRGAYRQRFDVSRVVPRAEHRALRPLWARTRIAELSDFAFGEPPEAAKKKIVELGLRYDLLTAYTSFVAVTTTVRNPGAPADDVKQPLALPRAVSNSAIGEPLSSADEPGLLFLLLASGLLGAAFLALRGRRRAALVTR